MSALEGVAARYLGRDHMGTTGRGDFEHVILTRFNVRMEMYPHAATDEWLQERLALFRRYCLPCVRAQTVRDFRWLLFFDAGSPDWFRAEVEALGDARFQPVWVDGFFDVDVVKEALRPALTASHLITTRLDNDDAIADDFVERVQAEYEGQRMEFVNLVDGSQLADGKVYLRPYPRNPFVSLIEEVGSERPTTVFASRHFAIDTVAPVRNVKTPHPMWLQVIHDDNTLNERVGLRARRARVQPYFSSELGLRPGDPQYLRDRIRDGGRIVMRLLRKPSRIVDLAASVFAPRSGSRGDGGAAAVGPERSGR
ncbi:glycosyltransferase [Leifsonia sp. TF02-11]|uniref:glycosyltransferase n=1 Tax=Leifsonia sp. TF02-11 TaxID=2815212 RepID=UPI001AA0CC21|nr:glycosyltransferase [Leifsonia sp. TF02-11]MBO1739142.1 hypothetical protein [Leifsonia sp. TF02-11]